MRKRTDEKPALINFKLIHPGKKAPFRQIADFLSGEIISGRIAAGSRLPTEIILAGQLGISRTTVGKAYDELLRMGLVTREKRRGTSVKTGCVQQPVAAKILALVVEGGGNGDKETCINHIRQEYLYGFQQGCMNMGFETLVYFCNDIRSFQLTNPRIDGLGLLTNASRGLPACRLPAVLLMGHPETMPEMDWVHADNWGGGSLAAKEFLALGHRKMACYSMQIWHRGVLERIKGFRSALQQAGCRPDKSWFPADNGLLDLEDFRRILSKPDRPTAIFATSDRGGMEILQLAQQLGISVPAELSVIAFDGTALADMCNPPLTTVFSDRVSMGRKAAEILGERLQENAPPGSVREIITPVTLKPGASTTAPPAAG